MPENNNNLNNIQSEPVLPKKKVTFVHVSAPNQATQTNNEKPSGSYSPQPANSAQSAPQTCPPPNYIQPQVQTPQAYGTQQAYNPYAQQYNYYNYNQYQPAQYQNPYYYPQAPLYNQFFSTEQYQKQLRVEQAKKKVRYLGSMSGAAILLFLIVNTLAAFFTMIPSVKALYFNSSAFQSAFSMVASFFYIVIPFFIIYKVIKKREPQTKFFPFDKIRPKIALLCIPPGLCGCLLGNIITTLFKNLLSAVGVELTNPADSLVQVKTIPELLLALAATAVMPALLEEFALRGVILQPLRKYGAMFAIICSSVVFGLMHGNFIQIPFATIVGISIAYLAIKCNSLWIGVIIHFCNNAFSVISSYINDNFSEKLATTVDYIAISAVVLLSIVSIIVLLVTEKDFFKKENGDIMCEDGKILSAGQKAFTFFVNAPMLISIALILLMSLQYVKF